MLPFVRVLNARGHTDVDDALQGQARTQHRMQGHTSTQRIAEQGARCLADLGPHRVADELRRRREVCPHGARVAVSGKVDRQQGVRLGQQVPRSDPRGDPSG